MSLSRVLTSTKGQQSPYDTTLKSTKSIFLLHILINITPLNMTDFSLQDP